MSFRKSLLLALLLSSCTRAPLKEPAGAFLPASSLPDLRDSYPIESLREAIGKTLKAFQNSTTIPAEFRFGERTISRAEYQRSLEALLPELESFERFHAFVKQNFDFYQVYGDSKPGEVFSTGYYDVVMRGSRKPAGKLTEPIYKAPADMVSVDLKAFAERLPDVKPLQDLVLESKSSHPQWKGRVVKEGSVPKVIPYYQRAQIQRERPLQGRQLELAYVDPIDAFFVEIQGSGIVEFPDGSRLRLSYGGQNGSPYVPIGRHLYDVIPKEQMSMQRIREYLETLPRERQQEIFDLNPSYVFFRTVEGDSLTYSEAETTAQRTIATDSKLFPKGTLGFMEIELPRFDDPHAMEPSAWELQPRWVLDQDTGGAIKGGGRTDLYMGKGEEAARLAGVMKRTGQLWVVAPKAEFLARLLADSSAHSASR